MEAQQVEIKEIGGLYFFRVPSHWHSFLHHGPSWIHLLRRKAEEIKASGIECQVIQEDWGWRNYALSIPLDALEEKK